MTAIDAAADQRKRRRARWRALCRIAAVSYPALLVVVIIALRLIGERWWVTTVGLYLPRLPFSLPLLPITAALIWLGPRRLLWTQALAALLLIFLLGFRISWPVKPTPGAFHLRVLTCNINTGSFGIPGVLQSLREADADVVVLQEVDPRDYARLRAGMTGYSIHESGQFWMASRFPILAVEEPPIVTNMGVQRSLRFVRYQVSTPAGVVFMYNIHPISPRDGLREVWGGGFRHDILRGRLFNSRARAIVTENTQLRLAQVEGLAASVRQTDGWVVMAGDTNLPDLSWAYAQWLGDYRDGFAEAGTGLGYTFPSPLRPWMRIDRILADPRLRFLSFRTLETPISDHRAVLADLELPPRAVSAR